MSIFEVGAATIPIKVDGMAKVLEDLNTVKGQLADKLGGGLMKGLGMLGIAVGIGAIVSKAIGNAMGAETKLHEMKDTLKATGQEVDNNVKSFQKLAANIQATTPVSKGAVMALIETGLKMGMTAEQAERLSTTALGLSKRLGIDATEALHLIARGDDRAMMALGRHSKEIANASTKQEKLNAINQVAAQGMEMLHGDMETGKGKWEHLLQNVDSLFTKLGQALLPAITAVIEGLSGFFDWIIQLIGATASFTSSTEESTGKVTTLWSVLGTFFSDVAKTMKEWIETIVFAFNNWDLTVKTVGITVAMMFVNIADRILWFGKQSLILLQWAVKNWQGLFIDVWNLGKTVFVNLVDNIKNIWSALISWFSGEGFNFKWTPLLKGFQSAIKEAPAFTQFVHSDVYNGLSQQLKEVDKDWEKRAGKWNQSMQGAKIDKKQAKEAVDATIGIKATDTNAPKDKGKGSGFENLVDFWKKAQESILKSEQKEAVNAAKKTAANTEKMAKSLEKMANRPAVAVAG